jgi:hypothetical protein
VHYVREAIEVRSQLTCLQRKKDDGADSMASKYVPFSSLFPLLAESQNSKRGCVINLRTLVCGSLHIYNSTIGIL